MTDCTPLHECLACGSTNLSSTLDLGKQPLANSFRDTADTLYENRYPLAINRCEHCQHLQLTHVVNPELIYTHYLYVSGTSGTYLEYMDWYAHFAREQIRHWSTSVLDIGCNDGSQLDAFKRLGYDTYGVDPAKNLYSTSNEKHKVICGFWNEDTSIQLDNKQFDIITTQNAFAHVPDPLKYLSLASLHLRDDGRLLISTSQADMVINNEFDTIYHEHISYYNAYSMKCLAERAGLYLVDVIKTPIHGTSYIFVLSKQPHNQYRINNILAMEEAAGLRKSATYVAWAYDVEETLKGLREQMDEYRGFGYRLVGYGAAAKGMTLLNASGIQLDAVVDDNPLKIGTWCPGTNIPVVNRNYISDMPTDDHIAFIPLAWNFYDEIVRKIREVRNNDNDLFVRYFPLLKTDVYEN